MLAIESVLGRISWCALLLLASFALGGCDSGGGGGKAAQQATTAPKSVLPPVGFSATADGFEVKLTWSVSPDSAKIVEFELERNGRPFTTSSATATTTTDEDVKPGKRYRYAIRSKGEGTSSEWVVDQAKIEVPPLKEARLEGDFSIAGRAISHYGYATYSAQNSNFAWRLNPKCPQGACDVVWEDAAEPSIGGVLQESNGRYRGTYRGYFFNTCHGADSISDVNIRLKVVKAQAFAGEWRATRIEGAVENHEAAQYGCTAAHAEVAIKGSVRVAG